MRLDSATAVRSLTVVTVVAFLGVLGWYLTAPGYTLTRLVGFAVLGCLAVVGAAGVLRHRPRWSIAAAIGLIALGFWQAVLWLFIYPMVGVLLLSTALDSGTESTESAPTR